MTKNIRFELIKDLSIPMEVFELRLLSPFENIVYYLTNAKELNQNEIAFLMKRNPRTIWTTLERGRNKIEMMRQREPKAVSYWESKLQIRNQIKAVING